jgi:hypothetical protein
MKDMKQVQESWATRCSALTYTSISLLMALTFLVASSLTGGYTSVARVGGAAWAFMLTMIVSMPFVTSRYKKAYRQ